MDKKSRKPNNTISGSNFANNGGNAQKKNQKKAGKTNAMTKETKGIDWNLYEEMYASTRFSKQYGNSDNKDKSINKDKRNNNVKINTTLLDKTSENARDGKKHFSDKDRTKGNRNGERSDKNSNQTRESKVRMKIPRTTASGEAICPVYKKCGGCQMQGIDYAKQLSIKQKKVEDLLGKFGRVEPILGMKDPYYYRNKVHAVFDRDRRGNYISGIYEEGSHEVVAVEDCLIQNKKANEIVNSIRGLLKSFKIISFSF